MIRRFYSAVSYFGKGRVCMYTGAQFSDGRVVAASWRCEPILLKANNFTELEAYLSINSVPQTVWIDVEDGAGLNDKITELFDLRRFYLDRKVDVTGVSGTGHIAEGILLPSGEAALAWITQYRSIGNYPNIADLVAIHGHEGSTSLVWLDEAMLA
jgi:hypothetical protein